MIIPVIFFAMAYSYALAVNFVPSYRHQADKVGEGEIEEKGNSMDMVGKDV
jgi:FHS family L-fucose permease-like MFS transporter